MSEPLVYLSYGLHNFHLLHRCFHARQRLHQQCNITPFKFVSHRFTQGVNCNELYLFSRENPAPERRKTAQLGKRES